MFYLHISTSIIFATTFIIINIFQSVVEAVSEVEVDQEIASVADQARVLSIGAWLSLLSTVTSRLNTVIARVKVCSAYHSYFKTLQICFPVVFQQWLSLDWL